MVTVYKPYHSGGYGYQVGVFAPSDKGSKFECAHDYNFYFSSLEHAANYCNFLNGGSAIVVEFPR
jgi:hypothetical protein